MAEPWDTVRHEEPMRIDRYEILSVLGQGGMGKVYLARDPRLDRKVAVKVLARIHSGPEEHGRFIREARAAAQITHPNICPIYEVGEEGEVVYFTMAYIEGTTLSAHIRDRRNLTPAAIATLVRKIALALAVAHERGIVHRDLKPSNILMDKRGEPIVADFGLARVQDEDRPDQTRSGMVLGTPAYMAPEQASGNPRAVGPRTDVYGLGAILYELLTGRSPFKAATALETLHRVLTADLEPPHRLAPNVPRDLEAICLKALARNPAGRYASMTELAEDLERFLNNKPVLAAPRKGFLGRLWGKVTGWFSSRKSTALEPLTPRPGSPSPVVADAGTQAQGLPDPGSASPEGPSEVSFDPLPAAAGPAKGTEDSSGFEESSGEEFHLTLERTVQPAPPTGECKVPPQPVEAHKLTQLAHPSVVPVYPDVSQPVASQGGAKEPPPPLAPPLADDFSERPFGNYVLIRKLGQGENGVVYLARHATQGWLTALKILPGARFSRPDCVQRLLREARIAAGLRHPNVCQVLDAGTVDGEFYLAMEYLEGKTLRARLQEHPGGLSVPLACYYAAQVLDALHYLARQQVVHRDVKPGNVMICAGDRLRVMDLGLAKSPDPAQGRLTLTGMVLGTPAYMSPEQIKDASSATPRSDLYSVGATLFEMLTGATPFRAASPVEMMARVLSESPADPRALRPDLPESLAGLVLRLLDKDPERRPGHEEVRQALDALGQEMLTLSVAAQPAAPDRAAPPGPRSVSILARIDDAREQIAHADGDNLLALLPKKDGKSCLGSYHLTERVGQKSAVNTYRAEHRHTRKPALVRILPLALAQMAPERVRDLMGQTTRLMEVSQTCPYLCPVLDIGDDRLTQGTFDTLYFTVEEYLEGKSLAELIGSDGLDDPAQVRNYLQGILTALEALHSRGLVHGNLHPGKLFRDARTGRLRLTDLSRARPAPLGGEAAAVHSGVHSVIGDVNWLGDHSPRHRQYLAPENLSGRLPPGPLSEQYAVGVMFVEMLTGQCLRTHPNDLELFECVQGDLQERLENLRRREKADGGSPRLSSILTKMVSVKPAMRFAGLGAVIRALASTKKRPAKSMPSPGAPDPQGPSRHEGDSHRSAETVTASDQTHLNDNKRRQVFLSYAWGDGTQEGEDRARVVEDLYQRLCSWGYEVIRDKENMKLGDRISEFMKRLGKGDRIIVILSEKYLRSVYCMTELHEIYLQSRADQEDFRRRIIPLSLPDASLKDIEDRAKRTRYWEDEGEKYRRLLRDGYSLAVSDHERHEKIRHFAIDVPNILALIADTLHPVGFDGIENNDFAGVKALLERSV